MTRASIGTLACALALLASSACGPPAIPPGGDALDASWLDGGGVTGERIEELAALARPDAEATAVFEEAKRRLGGSYDAVAARFSICPKADGVESGLTTIESQTFLQARTVEDLALGRAPAPNEAARRFLAEPARERATVDRVDVVEVEATGMPRICVTPTLTIGAAYEAVLHELVHALRMRPADLCPTAFAAADEASFLRAIVVAPGGEAQAYVVATRARRRLRGGHQIGPIFSRVDPRTFDAMTPDALTALILGPLPRGLGYADGLFRGRFAEVRGTCRKELETRRGVYAQLADDRAQNLTIGARRTEVLTHNLDVFTHNAEVGRARGDPSIEADARRSYATTEADLASTRRIVDAARESQVRVAAALADLDRRLGALPP